MKVFECPCSWRFIVGKKRVYGPVYAMPEHAGYSCFSQGRLMTREQFEDDYADCAHMLEWLATPAKEGPHAAGALQP